MYHETYNDCTNVCVSQLSCFSSSVARSIIKNDECNKNAMCHVFKSQASQAARFYSNDCCVAQPLAASP